MLTLKKMVVGCLVSAGADFKCIYADMTGPHELTEIWKAT